MSDLVYIAHASKYAVGSYDPSKYNPVKRHERYEQTKEIVGRKTTKIKDYKYGNYKSPYYDPVARHERYLRERSKLGIGTGGASGGKKSGGKGSGKGSGGKGSGKGSGGKGSGGKGSSKGSKSNMAAEIQRLREESALETEAQREAARRKIEDLQKQLSEQVKKLKSDALSKTDSEENSAERRGIIQHLKSEIENLQGKNSEEASRISKQLNDWITHERDSLERRIAAIYKANGQKYTPRTQASKENASKARNKEVKRRADSIYKSKSKK